MRCSRGRAAGALAAAALLATTFTACGRLLSLDDDVVPGDAALPTSSTDEASGDADAAGQLVAPFACPAAAVVDGGHCYWRGATGDNPQAWLACQDARAHLMTITDPWEEIIARQFAVSGRVWIGLVGNDAGTNDADAYHWVTGEPTDFKAWQAGTPNDGSRCVESDIDGWNDKECDSSYSSVCEWP